MKEETEKSGKRNLLIPGASADRDLKLYQAVSINHFKGEKLTFSFNVTLGPLKGVVVWLKVLRVRSVSIRLFYILENNCCG